MVSALSSRRTATGSPLPGAQRLTASMVSAQCDRIRAYGQSQKCSTPYGINGFGTRYHMVKVVNKNVLNALRHQWFRHQAKQAKSALGNLRAQRLTASMVSAPNQVPALLFSRGVLNALRHQWFRHSQRHRRITDARSAQRLTASMVSAPRVFHTKPSKEMCSTPYGINGFGTPRLSQQANALLPCSTPYGINGFGTNDRFGSGRKPARVLNALRHQWFRHGKFQQTKIQNPLVLNALRHQWFRHEASHPISFDGWSVLNALRHQWFRHRL